jgi:hypothetical protein
VSRTALALANPQLTQPWSSEDAIRWAGSTSVGVVMVSIAWWWASGEANVLDQLPAMTLAVAGAIVACTGHALWVLRGRRAVGERIERMSAASWIAEDYTTVVTALPLLVSAPESRLAHTTSCPMAVGRGFPVIDLASVVTRCGICRP